MTKGEKIVLVLTGGLVLLLLTIEGLGLWVFGPWRQIFVDKTVRDMVFETGCLFLWNLWFFSRFGRPILTTAGLLAGLAVFSWAYQIFWPLAVSGLYAAVLILAGKRLRLGVERISKGTIPRRECLWMDLVLGCSLWIVLVCGFSMAGLGGLALWRGLALVLAAAVLIWEGKDWKHRFSFQWRRFSLKLPSSWFQAAMAAFALSMLMVQLGRINIELDYDSLHYGLRSLYVLDNGRGIYENLGMVNLVYTYPKGLEILALPLNSRNTYGYVLCLSLWATVGIVKLAGQICTRMGGKTRGYLGAALVAAVPGIMNMGASAKCDNATLLFQLVLFNFAGCALMETFRKQQKEYLRAPWLVMGIAAYLMTLVLKPTAMVFSSVLALMGLAAIVYCGRTHSQGNPGKFLFLIVPAAAVAGVWYRTWRITGVPLTSIFASVFEKIGFQVRPPFNFSHVIGDSSGLTMASMIRRLIRRLLQMALLPLGEDMNHVIIAWGSGLVTVFVFFWLVWLIGFFRKKGLRKARSQGNFQEILAVFLIPVMGLACVVSVYQLSQVDGNYFELFYALILILGAGIMKREKNSSCARKNICALLMPVLAMNVLITCLSGWGGQRGFTPVSFFHKGYYSHQEEQKRQAQEQGIWDLIQDLTPRSRVVAFGDHPQVLSLPCSVQSYYDITGSGGNVVLVKKLDYFKEYLAYAQTQYIYVQAGYLGEQERARDLIRYMIEDGSLKDLRYSGGNLLGRVDLAAEPLKEEEAQRLLQEFDQNYQMNRTQDGT